MPNKTYTASRRVGGKAGPGKRRITVILPVADFVALRTLADERHHTIGGEAAALIALALQVKREGGE